VIYGSEGEEYVSPAKVLLSGLGSDELLGGYSRHKIAYNQGGWDGLISEASNYYPWMPAHIQHYYSFNWTWTDFRPETWAETIE
jgi:asparagine synthetase B (glutamine-hydrolysing)